MMTIKQILFSALILGSVANDALSTPKIPKQRFATAFTMNLNPDKFRESLPVDPAEFDRTGICIAGRRNIELTHTLTYMDKAINGKNFIETIRTMDEYLLSSLLTAVREDGKSLMHLPCVYCPAMMQTQNDDGTTETFGAIILDTRDTSVCEILKEKIASNQHTYEIIVESMLANQR